MDIFSQPKLDQTFSVVLQTIYQHAELSLNSVYVDYDSSLLLVRLSIGDISKMPTLNDETVDLISSKICKQLMATNDANYLSETEFDLVQSKLRFLPDQDGELKGDITFIVQYRLTEEPRT